MKSLSLNMTSVAVILSISMWTVSLTIQARNTAESYETSGEYCQDEIFNATCSYDSVINVTYAQFGRTEVGRCIQQNLYLGCMKDVTLYLNSMCLGKRSCHVSIMDSALRSHKPCPVDVTWHLKATYKCVHVIVQKFPRGTCAADRRVAEVTGVSSGYLASVDVVESGVGSGACPWRIHAKQGQLIQVTVYSSIIAQTRSNMVEDVFADFCYEVAIIKENAIELENRITLCGGDSDYVRIVFKSTTNVIDVEFTSPIQSTRSPQFILGFNVTGCATPSATQELWLRRQGNHLFARCNYSGEVWHLDCIDNHWSGTFHNCSSSSLDSSMNSDDSRSENFPSGLLITVATGVGLGVFLGGTALVILSWYMRRPAQPKDVVLHQEEVDQSFHTTKNFFVEDTYTQRKCDLLVTKNPTTGSDVTLAVDPWGCWQRVPNHSLQCTHCHSLPPSWYQQQQQQQLLLQQTKRHDYSLPLQRQLKTDYEDSIEL